MSLEARLNRKGLLFSGPLILGLILFVAYPVGISIYYSFCHFPPMRGTTWIGMDNYAELAGDGVFHSSLGATFWYAIIAIPLGVVLAFALAVLLNSKIRGQSVYRVIFYLPHLVPVVATAILWQWMYRREDGLINMVVVDTLYAATRMTMHMYFWLWGLIACWVLVYLCFRQVTRLPLWPLAPLALWLIVAVFFWFGPMNGGDGESFRPGWHQDASAALPKAVADLPGASLTPSWALWSIIFMSLWGVGQMAIIYLAKLQDVPQELYEAAEIDGAGAWHKLRYITIPLISPVILFNVIMGIIAAFQVFTEPYIMTGGGPEDKTRLVALFIYQQAFEFRRMGYASAVSWVLFVVILLLTLGALRLSRGRVFYAGD